MNVKSEMRNPEPGIRVADAMKTASDCSGWRETIGTWVCEGMVGKQTAPIQNHLAACAECWRYAQELQLAAASLRRLADRPVDPSPGFRARWTRAVEEEAQPVGLGDRAAALMAWWRDLLRRNLRPALGMASIWLLALLFRLNAPEVSPSAPTAAARSPIEIYRALKTSEQLLAREFGAAPAAPQKPHSARPRSEGLPSDPTAHQSHTSHVIYLTSVTPPILPSQHNHPVPCSA